MIGRGLGLVLIAGCGHAAAPATPPPARDPIPDIRYRGGDVALSRAADAQLVTIPAGQYIAGSTREERDVAYDAWRDAAGHDGARERGWFETEEDRHVATLPAYRLDLLPVTAAQYAEAVADGALPAPTMDEATWAAQGFSQAWPDEVVRHAWVDDRPPPGREDHPVVLVTYDQAAGYCAWRGQAVGEPRRLASTAELEKAARGAEAQTYPWGNRWDAGQLDSAVSGLRDTVAVGSFPGGKSPYGVLELAGNVFQWTSTPWPPGAGLDAARRTVKGSAWDDWPGLGRGASAHGRARTIRHVIVGFRCAADGAGPGR